MTLLIPSARLSAKELANSVFVARLAVEVFSAVFVAKP